jgi:site-specific DNA recombinase
LCYVARQLRAISDWLPAGWYIAAVYSDVESGATDLDTRSQGEGWRILTDAGLPRDGGMADLLHEAAAPNPRFSVVVCEDIERASRDTYDSLKLERKLGSHGIPLLATDEPADITGLNATTVLARRVKQGVAEWYRIQLKAKTRKGLEEHAIAGYNNGRVPFGYRPDRTPHPVPVKASQGRTKTRLAVDPQAGPWLTQMYEWRVYERLSREAIALRLDAGGAPSPEGEGWHPTAVGKILTNPKYTGYMVYGRTRNTGKSTAPGSAKSARCRARNGSGRLSRPTRPWCPASCGRPPSRSPPSMRGSGTRRCRRSGAGGGTRCGRGCTACSAGTG